jgi:hypothetical protein
MSDVTVHRCEPQCQRTPIDRPALAGWLYIFDTLKHEVGEAIIAVQLRWMVELVLGRGADARNSQM